MNSRNSLLMTFISTLFLSACSQQLPDAPASEVNLDSTHRHLKILASDEFGGRGPLTEGETLTIDYLAKQYRAMGLTGANKGSFFQGVPMAKLTSDQSMLLTIGDLEFQAGTDFTARTQQMNSNIRLKDSEVVFVGYGINAPEYHWNDYRDIDVKGKTVIVLVNDPGFATQDEKLFTGNAMTYYGRWTYKYEEAARQGAKAVLIVHETAPAAYPWSVVESSNTGSKYSLVDDNENLSKLPIMGWLQHEATQRVFAEAGLDFEQLKQAAVQRSFEARSLKLAANLELRTEIEHAESNNVLALIKGSTRPDETVIVSAHWDHFGTRQTAQGPKIFNGAIDNATGVAGTLEIARILMKRHKVKPFERSILFANFTAEETGMIGSELFGNGDLVPTENIVGLLNIDGMNALDGVDYVLQYGQGMSELEDYLARAASKQQRHVKPDPRPQNGLFFRSDHFSLAKQGVPGLLFMSLGDTDPDYISHKYHKEADDYSPSWSLGGMEQEISLIVDIASELASGDDWPRWKADSDFKKRREQDKR
ncbi:M28 family metallopeptidase [uncultured Shewanella sp.]|uniref:M28 family metallopeptidase n=1 Tax=uncultured Shewanella sp. TaxID=173975 RepID=UPI0026332C8C|nr:M28 family metallopeptidase [uncultured Shewanella sp.]